MKTLFLCPSLGVADFGMDSLWPGLIAKLGAQDLVDWPVAPRRRKAATNKQGSWYQQYLEERGSMCYTPQNPSLPQWTLDDVKRILQAEGFERVFVDETPGSFDCYKLSGLDNTIIPVVMIAAWLRPRIPIRIATGWYGDRLEAVFTDNWTPAMQAAMSNCHPINLGASNLELFLSDDEARALQADKKFDVCFVGANTHGLRTDHFAALKAEFPDDAEALVLYSGHSGLKFVPGDPPIMLRHEYFAKIAQARVAINLVGSAPNGRTIRFYEIPWVGSLMVTSPVSGQVWPLVDGVHCLYYQTIPEMMSKIRWALSHQQEAEKIALAGQQFVREHYGAVQRVEYVYSKLK